MASLADAYRVLSLEPDADRTAVTRQYRLICAQHESGSNRRTNMPAIHHSYKLICGDASNDNAAGRCSTVPAGNGTNGNQRTKRTAGAGYHCNGDGPSTEPPAPGQRWFTDLVRGMLSGFMPDNDYGGVGGDGDYSEDDDADDDDDDDSVDLCEMMRDKVSAKPAAAARNADWGYVSSTKAAAASAHAEQLLRQEEEEELNRRRTDQRAAGAKTRAKKKRKKPKKSAKQPPESGSTATVGGSDNVETRNGAASDGKTDVSAGTDKTNGEAKTRAAVEDDDNCSATSFTPRSCCSSSPSSSSDSEGEGLDLNSAFARASIRPAEQSTPAGAADVPGRPSTSPQRSRAASTAASEPLDAFRRQAQDMAIQGNTLAGQEQFAEAIKVFSIAIKLDPNDHRFFGNRGFCYERLLQFDKALKDADRAIELDDLWPKGHFRRGRALLGQKRYDEAEAEFRRVLELDSGVDECHHELFTINVYRLMQLGFSRAVSRVAARKHSQFESALESLMVDVPVPGADDVLSDSDDDDIGSPDGMADGNVPLDPKEDPSNVEGLTSLWVGNITNTVTARDVQSLFARYGAVTSVRLLVERRCAFVNFRDSVGASNCIKHLQGVDFHGQFLKIKFPDRPVENGPANFVVGKRGPGGPTPRVNAPVLERECFYWRTSHCIYGDNCRFRHVPAHRLIDRRVR